MAARDLPTTCANSAGLDRTQLAATVLFKASSTTFEFSRCIFSIAQKPKLLYRQRPFALRELTSDPLALRRANDAHPQ